jgi:hypothetical protein
MGGIRRNTSSKFDHFSRVSSTEMADSYRLRICFYWPRTLRRRLCPDHKGVTDKETQWSFKIHENSDRDEESDNRIDNGT